jgi:hypothetical protein
MWDFQNQKVVLLLQVAVEVYFFISTKLNY